MISLYNLYLQKQLINKLPYHNDIDKSKIVQIIIKQHSTKELALMLIKEMELNNLIKIKGKIGKVKVDIINPHHSKLLENPSKVYHLLNCW